MATANPAAGVSDHATVSASEVASRHGALVLPELGFDAPDRVRETLAALGRTEDVRLSPSGRRLAIACYLRDVVAVADVELAVTADGPAVVIENVELLSSPAILEPHGVDFLDDETMVVASRSEGLGVFRLPAPGSPTGEWELEPVARAAPSDPLDAPGSVASRRNGVDRHEILACVNWAHTIRRHDLDGEVLTAGDVVAARWLDVPDGVSISCDGRWVAVSNHFTHTVFVYEHASLGTDATPVGILRGVKYPHGLRFAAGDERLVVADAGAPHVHVFAATARGWHGASYPAATIRVMDDATFSGGNHTPQEGGPKGIDLDPRTKVLLVTSEATPLSLFDAGAIVERPWAVGRDEEALVDYELHALATAAEHKAGSHLAARLAATAESANALAAELAALRATKTWRLTEPVRRAYGTVRRRSSRPRS
jgi:DNA-binding beta-propeller fold protein YncE